MRVLQAHNHYQQPGGEDQVFAAEARLLEDHGHRVERFTVHNDEVRTMGHSRLAFATIWNRAAYRGVQGLLRQSPASVAHFHNTFPLISPAAYYAARRSGAAVVQSLHNYRLLCPNALLFREGTICENCLPKVAPWPSVVHGCYRGSRVATAGVAIMLTAHRARQTYSKMVDVYVALTEFARRKFIQGGLPAEKIMVKPNFVHPDPGPGGSSRANALFVGRLSPEKGLPTLLSAWAKLEGNVRLTIVGDGPAASLLGRPAGCPGSAEWLGRRPRDEVFGLMGGAAFLIFPSQCYEGLPTTIIEAFAKGTPVIASNLGAMAEIVEDGRTGLHFRPGDPDDLAAKVEWAWTHPKELAAMGRAARAEYEAKYTAEHNYTRLMEIYAAAIARAQARR